MSDSYDYHADMLRTTRDELIKRRNLIRREIRDRERHLKAIDEAVQALDAVKEVRRGMTI